MARVKVNLRRARNVDDTQVLQFRHIRIDVQRHEEYRDDERVELTTRERSSNSASESLEASIVCHWK